jgi:hypothetical protein
MTRSPIHRVTRSPSPRMTRSPSPPVAPHACAAPADACVDPTATSPLQPPDDGGEGDGNAQTKRRFAMTQDVRKRVKTVVRAVELLDWIGCEMDAPMRNDIKEATMKSFAPWLTDQ